MSNKIKCTCGHSWNKSSSSKKDMNICHICGKDNTMQMGGFVYPVNYVPQKENGGWLDAYDDTPQAENGIEGTMGGLTDKGFDYNGAWGGTMQEGGKLTAEQLESLNKAKMRSKMALAAAFGNPSAMRMTSVSPSSYTFSGNEMIDGESVGVRPGETGTHYMSSMGEYAVPYIQEGPNGKLRFNSNASFRDKEAIRFDNPKDAQYFAEHYKEVAPMMKRYAMGGSLPGSVGFTYARTKGIPSEGPYAKKTIPSAQNGQEMKFYQEGLDWKPRNISRDGSEIPQAQLGLHMLTPDYNQVGENIMEMLSVPQKALTKLFSGKYQTPSEAMGIKNKVGAIATDMLLDPLNLMGAGVVAKASTETGALSKAYKYNPWAFKADPEAYYHRSPNLENIVNQETRMLQGFGESEAGRLFSDNNRLVEGLNLKKGANSRLYFAKGTPLDWGRTNMILDEKTGKMIPGQGYPGPYIAEVKGVPMGASTKGRAPGAEPTKIGSYAVSKRPISVDETKFYKEHWLKGYKEIKPPKKKEKGGDIKKDDNGYWNPENWGKPVEIGSNEITMKGLQEMGYDNPLLGISNTGDVQMMYPGEDYTFDGESVTEYPVAQKGIKVPAPTRADSIMLLKNSILKNAFYKNNPNYTTEKSSFDFKDPKLLQKLAERSENTKRNYKHYKDSDIISEANPHNPKQFTITSKDIKRRVGKVSDSNNIYSAPDIISGDDIDTYFNPASPPIFFSPSILPQGAEAYYSTKSSGYGDVAESPYYDPLAVAPWDMLSPPQQKLRLKKYGISGTPYDLPKQSPPPPVKTIPTQKPKTVEYQKTKLINIDPRGSKGKYDNQTNSIFSKLDPNVEYEKIGESLYKPINKKPAQSAQYKKPEPKKEQTVKKEQPSKQVEKPSTPVVKTTPPAASPIVEKRQNIYEGSPVYSPGAGSGLGSALIGFLGQQGDTTYIKPEDYERFAVPKYGKEFIESNTKKKKNGGWLDAL